MKGIYAGSFDPPTNGHEWMINEGARLFDEFIVSIGINPEKKYVFSLDERIEMLNDLTKSFSNVKISDFEDKYLVNYAKEMKADYILRGIRNENDYSFERGMRYINEDLDSDIQSVFLIPSRNLVEVSSSLVKGLIGPEGWEEGIKNYVSPFVYEKLLEKYKK
ncbi:pantetheine-phosphate adenylyltransferase [archaeon]|jgi:pantetheine-phosphate adenylyltransferase|nr:pantetheine-phosphate adenylyltransferase [archaeon]